MVILKGCSHLLPRRLQHRNNWDDDEDTKNADDDIPKEQRETPMPSTPEETLESVASSDRS